MKKTIVRLGAGFGAILLLLLFGVGFSFYQFEQLLTETYPLHGEIAAVVKGAGTPNIDLGRRIYEVRNGCMDCHGANLAGAKVMEDPAMGSIWGANISPYKIKNRTDEDLVRAIRYGVHPSGRSLRFMPSFDFEGMSANDILSVIAYLRSMPEVVAPDHENSFGPMARVLSVAGKMPVMLPARVIDHSVGFALKPAEGPTAEFGKYLAGSCVGCHGKDYRGGPIPGGDPSWPVASNIRLGGAPVWTRAEFMRTIEGGVSAKSGKTLQYPMPIGALQKMDETEKEALWQFLVTLQ